jgi:hypothetical protein
MKKFDGIAAVFFNAGPGAVYRLVADWMRRQQEAGHLAAGDSDLLARLYLDMLTGDFQLAHLLSVRSKPDAADISKTVETAAAIFLRGVSQATNRSLRSAVKAAPRDK